MDFRDETSPLVPNDNTSLTVLLAEDNEHDVLATERAWQILGYPGNLHIVRDGDECIDYLLGDNVDSGADASSRPQLLLLDIDMPKVDGLEVLRTIRSSPLLRWLPVVMLTTSSDEKDLVACYEAGANAYVVKPDGLEVLCEALRKIHDFWALSMTPDG